MEYGFSILMFCFSGALLLYAGLLAAEKRRHAVIVVSLLLAILTLTAMNYLSTIL